MSKKTAPTLGQKMVAEAMRHRHGDADPSELERAMSFDDAPTREEIVREDLRDPQPPRPKLEKSQ